MYNCVILFLVIVKLNGEEKMYDDYGITEIRILPSNIATFPTTDAFEHFVKETMVNRGGLYYFPGQMMQCEPKTLVLFQYRNEIRAVGVLIEAKRQNVTDENGAQYAGFYRFILPTLQYLSESITREELSSIVPEFPGFNQTKHRIAMHHFKEVIALVESKISFFPVEKIEDFSSPLTGNEKEVLVKARINQGQYRQMLIRKYHCKCCLCGVTDDRMLIASHIKPWSRCDAYEKVAEYNGLLLCPNHDRLFDKGLISFKDSGEVIISETLSNNDRLFLNIREGMRINIETEQLPFVRFHRKEVFDK